MGAYTMMFSTCFIIAPVLGTYILDNYGFSTLWWSIGSLNILSVVGFQLVKKLKLETTS
jgi:hypothetical protein